MSRIHVFDLDGTLFDTFNANKAAYEFAGLAEYKEQYYWQTAAAWECPPEIHERKTQVFQRYAYLITPSWAMPFFEIAEGCHRAVVLTGASAGSVRVMEKIHGKPFPTPFGITHNEESKQKVLSNLIRTGWKVTYYDDNVEMGERLVSGFGTNPPIHLVTPENLRK